MSVYSTNNDFLLCMEVQEVLYRSTLSLENTMSKKHPPHSSVYRHAPYLNNITEQRHPTVQQLLHVTYCLYSQSAIETLKVSKGKTD